MRWALLYRRCDAWLSNVHFRSLEWLPNRMNHQRRKPLKSIRHFIVCSLFLHLLLLFFLILLFHIFSLLLCLPFFLSLLHLLFVLSPPTFLLISSDFRFFSSCSFVSSSPLESITWAHFLLISTTNSFYTCVKRANQIFLVKSLKEIYIWLVLTMLSSLKLFLLRLSEKVSYLYFVRDDVLLFQCDPFLGVFVCLFFLICLFF